MAVIDFTKVSSFLLIVLGAIVGSLGTLLIERKKHKYSLQKEYFNNKLKVAEAIIDKLTKMKTACSLIARLFPKIPDMAESGRLEDLTHVIKKVVSDITNISEETTALSSKAGLYFDIMDSKKFEQLGDTFLNQFFDSVKKIGFLIQSQTAGADTEKIKEEALAELNNLSACFASIAPIVEEVQASIRNEMKKYEG